MWSNIRSLFGHKHPKHKKASARPFEDVRFLMPVARKPKVDAPPPYYLAIATVLRNEGPYLREWIAFYKAVGVDHIVIYDNGSTDGFQSLIQDHCASGFVEVIPWPHFVDRINFQHLGFAHAVSYMSGRTTWLALIDLDEFLFSTRSLLLSDTLKAYEDLPALAVYWMNYGTSGHKDRPDGLVIENYTRRAADNGYRGLKHYKSIVQPHRIKAVLGAHRFLTDLDPTVAFNENRVPLLNENRKAQIHTANILRINHYYSRSQTEFETRSRDGWGFYRPEIVDRRREFLSLIERDQVEDAAITGVIPYMRPWL